MKRDSLWQHFKPLWLPLCLLLVVSFPVCGPIWRDNDDAPVSRLLLMHFIWYLFCLAYYNAWFACRKIIHYLIREK
jgi:hypothetical protein